MNQQEKELIINIPAFISEFKEINEDGAIFRRNIDELVEDAKVLIAEFNNKNQQPIITDKRSKKTTKL